MPMDIRLAMRKALHRAKDYLRAKQRKNPKYAAAYDAAPYSIVKETKQYAQYLRKKYNRAPNADIIAVAKLYGETLVLTRKAKSVGLTSAKQAKVTKALANKFVALRNALKQLGKTQRRLTASDPESEDI